MASQRRMFTTLALSDEHGRSEGCVCMSGDGHGSQSGYCINVASAQESNPLELDGLESTKETLNIQMCQCDPSQHTFMLDRCVQTRLLEQLRCSHTVL